MMSYSILNILYMFLRLMCFYYLVINIMIYLLYLFVDMNLICLVHFKYCTYNIFTLLLYY